MHSHLEVNFIKEGVKKSSQKVRVSNYLDYNGTYGVSNTFDNNLSSTLRDLSFRPQ